MSQWHLGEFPWWAAVTAGIVAVLAVGVRVAPKPIRQEACDLSVATRGREPPRILVGSVPI